MNPNSNVALDEQSQDSPAIALWNLHKKLTQLAEELAKAADNAKAVHGNDNLETPKPALHEMSPRAYFKALLMIRRTREQYFGSSLFGEPAWDIMLELMLARIDNREMKTSELGIIADALGTDARQLVDTLEKSRLIDRFHNAEDEGDDYLVLSSEAARRMAELYRARLRA